MQSTSALGARKLLGNQNIGTSRSRGGKTTKIHALVNEHFQLIGAELTGGEVHDCKVAIKLLSKIALEGKKILADMAFCSDEIREYISQEKAAISIADESNADKLSRDFFSGQGGADKKLDKLSD